MGGQTVGGGGVSGMGERGALKSHLECADGGQLGLGVLAEEDRRFGIGGAQQGGELAEGDNEVVMDLLHLGALCNLGRQQQALQGLGDDVLVLCMVQHNTDGCHRGTPHQLEHVLVQLLGTCRMHQPFSF